MGWCPTTGAPPVGLGLTTPLAAVSNGADDLLAAGLVRTRCLSAVNLASHDGSLTGVKLGGASGVLQGVASAQDEMRQVRAILWHAMDTG